LGRYKTAAKCRRRFRKSQAELRYHEDVPTYHVQNFGCRATQADGAAIERQFASRGLNAASAVEADVVVLNTCTVTNSADQDARAAIRRVRRTNPQAKIIVTGCYAQRAPQEIAALPGVACVVGNSHKHELADLALNRVFSSRRDFVPLHAISIAGQEQISTEDPIYVSDIFAHTELLAAPVFESLSQSDRTRPNLKVQDGCDNRCSFCVIPSVRGQSRSLPMAQVIGEVNALVAAGYRELVISGINLGRWGRDLALSSPPSALGEHLAPNDERPIAACPEVSERVNDRRLEVLIRAILEQTSLEKLRISSVEPMDWSDGLISLVACSPRIAKHAHVPMQSGSDAVLRRMHRKYRPWHYREKIEKIRAAMPSAAIGADVMAGFPGESDTEFEATRRLIEELPFTYLHVFTYSGRPGTPAAQMTKQVPVQLARERNKILRDLAAAKKTAFMHSLVGRTVEAITLTTKCQRDGALFSEALTDNYQKLWLKGNHESNHWIIAEVECVKGDALVGSVIANNSTTLYKSVRQFKSAPDPQDQARAQAHPDFPANVAAL
jgi:threonylcarbamoyladenosine tRNA methylthiotransferase MtaB